MKLKNYSLGARMGLGFGLVVLLLLVVTYIGCKNMTTIQGKIDRIYHVNNARMILAEQMLNEVSVIAVETRDVVLLGDQSAKEKARQNIVQAREEYAQALSKLKELDTTAEGVALIGAVETAIAQAASLNNQVIELGLAGDTEAALPVITNQAGPAIANVQRALEDIVAYQQERNEFRYHESVAVYHGVRRAMLTTSGLAIVLGILVAFFITRSVTKPVTRLVAAAHTAAAGDLTVEMKEEARDEIGRLTKDFGDMIRQMRQLVRQITQKADTVASSAKNLSAGAEETSASAEETAGNIAEIAANLQQITANIQQVAAASSVAGHSAHQGNQGIISVTDQMGAIVTSTQHASQVINSLSQRSLEINQIVELITAIADQTNLLALNAAIEAARAGEQGRGFAVVAEEVRHLAEQSAGAAKEIKQLIAAIQVESQRAVETMASSGGEVEAGALVVQEVGQSFKEIIAAVEGLAAQIQQVADATDQMNTGVESVSAATEQQTAAMEEVAASSDNLTQLSVELNQLVRKFKT